MRFLELLDQRLLRDERMVALEPHNGRQTKPKLRSENNMSIRWS